MENEAGVDGVLARRTPMDETHCFLVVLADEGGELLDERNGEISGEGGGSSDFREIEKTGLALYGDCGRRGGRNHADFCFGAGQRGFEIEHALDAGSIRE